LHQNKTGRSHRPFNEAPGILLSETFIFKYFLNSLRKEQKIAITNLKRPDLPASF
jgi:hypothetical protein